MQGAVDFLLRGERVWCSNWSIVHFLVGLVPHALYAYLLTWDHWISLYVLALGACLFELFENGTMFPQRVWGGLGYTSATYQGDSLQNSVCDVVFALLGWGVAQAVYLLTSSMIALYVLLGVAALLGVLFLWLFHLERARWPTTATAGQPMAPAVPPLVSPPAPAPVTTGARVRFTL